VEASPLSPMSATRPRSRLGVLSPNRLIRLLKTADFGVQRCVTWTGRSHVTSTMSRKKPKICHFGRHFIKVPQTVAWGTVNIAVWINFAGLGLDPLIGATSVKRLGNAPERSERIFLRFGFTPNS
jgi:hypothetical protein